MITSRKPIVIVDYGLGNLTSLYNAFVFLNIPVKISRNVNDLMKSCGLILPGVGAFSTGMTNLHQFGLVDPIKMAIANGKPLLGICLGFQLLFSHGTEHEDTRGLNLLLGEVIHLSQVLEKNATARLLNVGWRDLMLSKKNAALFESIDNPCQYFSHSYVATGVDSKYVLAESFFQGRSFVSAIQKERVFGVQCHPEKSGNQGLHILKQFYRISTA